MKYQDSLELIINDLKNTKLAFVKGNFHQKEDKEEGEKCAYCAEGILLRKSGVPKNELTDAGIISELTTKYLNHVNKRYGIDFDKRYEPTLRCPLRGIYTGFFGGTEHPDSVCNSRMYSLEDLITHLNDNHSHNHKETAELLMEVSKHYNLKTGAKLK